ncbi:DNA-binding transcriptional regulator YhcF (GntR family) [Streptomyces ambofaciens]
MPGCGDSSADRPSCGHSRGSGVVRFAMGRGRVVARRPYPVTQSLNDSMNGVQREAEIVENFQTTHQRVVHELGRRIVAGAWVPGASLPVEDALAAEIGVSRGVLREAVKSLVAKGMLHVRPRTGTRVLPPEQWNHLDRDVLRWKQAGDAAALLRDTGELRRIVEPEAARLAADRAGPDDVSMLYESLAAMEARGGGSRPQRVRRGRHRLPPSPARRGRQPSPRLTGPRGRDRAGTQFPHQHADPGRGGSLIAGSSRRRAGRRGP